MTAFDRAAATLHRDKNLGMDAYYRVPPAPFPDAPIRVIISTPTDALGAVIAGTVAADVLCADATPERGAELRIGAATYRVESADRDAQATSWRCSLSGRAP
jgi:hypothetical protein